MIKTGSMSESEHLDEALKVANYSSFGGPNKPFPDGSAKGDLFGKNKAISVEVAYTNLDESRPYNVEFYFNDSDEDELATIEKTFKTGKEAIAFAEKLLKEVNNPLLDPKKLAKHYGMEYVTP